MRRIASRQPLLLAALACFAMPLAGGEAFAQQGGGAGARAAADDAVAPRSAGASRSVMASAAKSRGRDGRRLQRKLGIPADGVFGPQTKRAVRRFQRRHGLTADGIVGPVTRQALGLGSGPVLKRGGDEGSGGDVPAAGPGALGRLISAANRIHDFPYKFGGGHRTFDDTGYDCSGSISYALHAAGLLKYALDSSAFMSYGEPGPGRHVTIYANPNHAYMVVDGRRYDTSALRETGSRWTSKPRAPSGFVVRHPPGL